MLYIHHYHSKLTNKFTGKLQLSTNVLILALLSLLSTKPFLKSTSFESLWKMFVESPIH